jgi:hypothetical protein
MQLLRTERPDPAVELGMHSKQYEHRWGLENSRGVTIDSTNSERELPMYSGPHLQDRMNLNDRGSAKYSRGVA